MNRREFLKYVDHFNNKRFDKVAGYFCPDVTLAYPDNFMGPQIPGLTGKTLHGPKAFIANYEALTANVREVLNIGAFLSRGRQFLVELITEFHVLRTPPKGSPGAQWKAGDLIIMNQNVIYDLDAKGKFKRIRIFHHRYLTPHEAKKRIKLK
ncbi:MAG: hypothetical protein JXA73_15545 [Acidobacteria bacterium]|nr:hypothetical protein [Acidobacteriota bacterium]